MQLGGDVLHHRAWNNLPAFAEREFKRVVLGLTATIKL